MLSHIDSDTTILCSHRKDVNKYNDLIIHKMFHANENFDVMMKINAMDVEHVENWLHDSKFDHIINVAIGTRIMIIENINISKGVMNGTFATITTIIFNNDKIITNITIKIISTNIQIMFKRQTLQHKYTYETCYYKTSYSIVLKYANGIIMLNIIKVQQLNLKLIFTLKIICSRSYICDVIKSYKLFKSIDLSNFLPP